MMPICPPPPRFPMIIMILMLEYDYLVGWNMFDRVGRGGQVSREDLDYLFFLTTFAPVVCYFRYTDEKSLTI
jgi:hypothetical protein